MNGGLSVLLPHNTDYVVKLKGMSIVKKIIALLICVSMLAAFVPAAMAAYVVDRGTCGDNLTWKLDSDGTLTISGTGDMEDYTSFTTKTGYYTNAPWYGKSVIKVVVNEGATYIGNYAFAQLSDLTTVEIANSVVSVGKNVFDSASIKNIEFSDNMTLSEGMFSYLSIETIALPENITEIPEKLFYSCKSLKSVTLPKKLKTIGACAFYNCISLENLILPDTITEIGASAFQKCSSLESINLPDNVVVRGSAFEDCKNLISISEKQTITLFPVGGECFLNCKNLSNNIIIADGTETIGDEVFDFCESVKKIVLPDTLKTIGEMAFRCSGIISINLPDGLEKIDNAAFNHCLGLKYVEIPDSVVSLYDNSGMLFQGTGAAVFGACSNLEYVKIGKGAAVCDHIFGTTYGSHDRSSDTNYYPNLKKVIYPYNEDGLQTCQILHGFDEDKFVFYYTGSENDGISYGNKTTSSPETSRIKYIYEVNYNANGGENAPSYQPKFPGENLTITSNIPKRDGYKFLGWAKSSTSSNVDYTPGSIYSLDKSITLYAVWKQDKVDVTGVSLNKTALSLTIGDTEILTATIMPSDATDKAVTWTSSNTSVATVSNGTVAAKSAGTATITVKTADGGYSASCIVNVTKPAENVVDSGTCGNNLTWRLDDAGVLTISGTGEMTDYLLGSSSAPWYGSRSSIKSVTIGSGVTSIGAWAFGDCTSLASITIPEGVTSIVGSAFRGCTSLASITIPNSVTSIGEEAFSGCDSLASITIGSGVTSIGWDAFDSCTSLTDVYYGGSEEDWAKIEIDTGNDCLLNANIHLYESDEPTPYQATLALAGGTTRSILRNMTIIITTAPQGAPEGAYVAWSVEDPTIAEVVSTAGDYDNLGTIKGITKGTTTVAAMLCDKDGNILYYKIITVVVKGTSAGGDLATLTVGTVSARAGETVTVPITISDNPGIAGFNLVINYDNTLLTPVSIEKGAALTVGTLTSNIQQGGDLSAYDCVTAYWVNPSNVTENGEILNVTFEIAADAEEGEIPVTVTYEEGDVTNQDYEDIALDITDGAVTVINILPGDVYQDGVVNTKDGVRLSQYLAKWAVELTGAEEKAADVYQDGVINTKDGVRLSQYLAKWDVTLGGSTLMGMKLFSSAVIGFEVGKVNAKAGEYVDIPVYITKNTGVAGFNLQLNYDKALLTPVSITQGAALTSGTITSNIQQGGDLSRFDAVTAYWANPSNITSTGEAFTVRFLVSESEEGEIPVTLSYDEYDVPCDQNLNELDVEIVNGSVVTEGEPMPKAMDYTVNSLTGTVRDGSFYAEASVTKNTDRAAADTIVIAVYKDGALADMTYMKSEFAAGQTAVFGGRLTGTDGAVLKAFVWDSIEGMKALSNIIEK